MSDPTVKRSRHLLAGHSATRRRRFMPLALVSAVAATALLSLSMTGALSSFSASIANSTNTISSATVQLSQLQTGGTTCLSTASGAVLAANANTTCTNNAFGGGTAIVPGAAPAVQTITVSNVGTGLAGSLTLTAPACVNSDTGSGLHGLGSLCGQVDVAINETTSGAAFKCWYPVVTVAPCAGVGTAAALSTAVLLNSSTTYVTGGVFSLGPLTGTARTFTVSAGIDTLADNTMQGRVATQALTWALSQ